MSARTIAPVRELAEAAAVEHGVCVRPLAVRRVDNETGEKQPVGIRCGSTREQVCPSCAGANHRLRMHQAREGWHRDTEPHLPPIQRAAAQERRVRSTRRRQDVPDLPRQPVAPITVGKVYAAADGKTWRPSTFITLTLSSYGPVRADGSPVDLDNYDYRRAARDAIHFSALIDRFWQNLRRAVGWEVQYFAAVEAQRRGAPHLHAAVRGTMPRKLIRQVVAATYHQVWWPTHDEPVYSGVDAPVWDEQLGGYVDRTTRVLLPTWDEALDAIDGRP